MARGDTPLDPPGIRGGLLALVFGALGIACASILAKLAIAWDGGTDHATQLSPVATAFWRMALAAPVFALLSRRGPPLQLRKVAPSRLRAAAWLLLPGFLFASDIGLWHWSFEFTSVANATLESNFAVVLVSLAGWIFLGERFAPLFVVGAALALGGMVTLVGAGFGQGDTWVGDLLGTATAFFYAGYQLATKRLVGRVPVSAVMALTCTGSALFLALGAVLTPGRFFPQTAAGWAAVTLLALSAQVLGQGLIAFGLRHVPASLASVVLMLRPWAPRSSAGFCSVRR